MRTGFAILLLVRFPTLASLPAPGAELRFPNGLAKWIDMSWALDLVSYSIITVLLTVGAVLYITGFAFPLSATVLLLCYLIVGPNSLIDQPLLPSKTPMPLESLAPLTARRNRLEPSLPPVASSPRGLCKFLPETFLRTDRSSRAKELDLNSQYMPVHIKFRLSSFI